jgi:hypothetical protein
MRARAALLLAAVASAPAAAEDRRDDVHPGVLLQASVGYALARGELVPDQDLADLVPDKVPVRLAVAYRFTGRFRAGLFFEIAPARVDSSSCVDGSCDASSVRIGISAEVHLAPGARLDPWLGLGAGAEVLEAEGRDPLLGVRSDLSYTGFELPFVEAGLDIALRRDVTVGPFVSAAFGQYTRATSSAGDDAQIAHRASHGWLQAGARLTVAM